MSQTKLGSMTESIMNIIVGIGFAFGSQLVIFPLYGIHVPIQTNLGITAWFTLVSIVRSYIIRRWFNGFKRFNSNFES